MRICSKCFNNSLFSKFGKPAKRLKQYFNLDDICMDCVSNLQKTMEEEITEKRKETGRRLSSKQYLNSLSVGKISKTINY